MLTHRVNTALFLMAVGVWIILRYFYPLNWIFLTGIFLLWGILTVIGSFHIRWNYHLSALHRSSSSENIALTFDDGPTEYTGEILDLLSEYNQKASFFLIGNRVQKYPDIVRRIVAEGHSLGNHTQSHSPYTGFLNVRQMESEIRAADQNLKEVTGKPVNLYRPPYGVTNPSIRKAVRATGHTVMGWSVRSLDTLIRSETRILRRILRRIKPGGVVLLHDTSAKTVRVCRMLLPELQRRSLRSVTLHELFKQETATASSPLLSNRSGARI